MISPIYAWFIKKVIQALISGEVPGPPPPVPLLAPPYTSALR
jgi:hypothetical protein